MYTTRYHTIFCFIILSLVITPFSYPVKAADSSKAQTNLKQIQGEKTKVKEDLKQASSRLDTKKQEINHLEQQITHYDTKLDKYNQQLALNMKQLNYRKRLYYQLISKVCVSGDFNYMAKLMTAKSFSEFVVRLETVRLMIKKQRETFYAYLRIQEAVNRDLLAIRSAKSKQDPLLKKAKMEVASLEKMKISLHQNLDKIEEHEELTKEELREISGPSSGYYGGGSGTFIYPTSGGYIRKNFGESRGGHVHKGVDIINSLGAPIYAADSGVVTLTKANPGGYGYYVVINHGSVSTLYAHMYRSRVLVKRGQRVQKGQKIAYVGNNGRSTAPHLHFEVHRNGSAVNPIPYLG